MYANYKNRKLSTQNEKSGPYESRTHTLALLAPRSANWANGPLIQMYANTSFLKIRKLSTQKEKSGPYESRTHDLSVISTTLCQLSKYIVFKQWMYANYLKIESLTDHWYKCMPNI